MRLIKAILAALWGLTCIVGFIWGGIILTDLYPGNAVGAYWGFGWVLWGAIWIVPIYVGAEK